MLLDLSKPQFPDNNTYLIVLSGEAKQEKCETDQAQCLSLPHRRLRHAGVPSFFFFLNKLIYFVYLFSAALGLHCCARLFSSCGEWGLLFVAVHRLLIAVASLVAESGL